MPDLVITGSNDIALDIVVGRLAEQGFTARTIAVGSLGGVETWMADREYVSVAQLKGSLSQRACPDPAAFERSNYMKALKSYTSEYA